MMRWLCSMRHVHLRRLMEVSKETEQNQQSYIRFRRFNALPKVSQLRGIQFSRFKDVMDDGVELIERGIQIFEVGPQDWSLMTAVSTTDYLRQKGKLPGISDLWIWFFSRLTSSTAAPKPSFAICSILLAQRMGRREDQNPKADCE